MFNTAEPLNQTLILIITFLQANDLSDDDGVRLIEAIDVWVIVNLKVIKINY